MLADMPFLKKKWLTCEEDKRKYRDEHFATDLQNAHKISASFLDESRITIVPGTLMPYG